MKNKIKLQAIRGIAGIVALLAAIGLSMAACGDGSSDPAPTLTGFITMTEANAIAQQWVPKTSFQAAENIGVGIRGSNPSSQNVERFVITAKKNGVVTDTFTYSGLSIASGYDFSQFISPLNLDPGNYTLEVYAADSKGNKSNVLTTSVSVQ